LSEVIEDYSLHVRALKNIWQLLTVGVEDAHPRLLLDALGKHDWSPPLESSACMST
jgi:hypothetical protein